MIAQVRYKFGNIVITNPLHIYHRLIDVSSKAQETHHQSNQQTNAPHYSMAPEDHNWKQSSSYPYIQDFASSDVENMTPPTSQRFSFFHSQVARIDVPVCSKDKKHLTSSSSTTSGSSDERQHVNNRHDIGKSTAEANSDDLYTSNNHRSDLYQGVQIPQESGHGSPHRSVHCGPYFEANRTATPSMLPPIRVPRDRYKKQRAIRIMDCYIKRNEFECGCMSKGICVHYMLVLNGFAQDTLICQQCSSSENIKHLSVDRPCPGHNNPKSQKYMPNLPEDFPVPSDVLERAEELYERTWNCHWS